MRAKIYWSQRARRDLLEIGDFIARDKPETAAAWVNRIVNAVERAAVFPSSGRVIPESDRTDIREVILDHNRIVYLLGNARITVLTLFESHRRLVDDDLDNETSR